MLPTLPMLAADTGPIARSDLALLRAQILSLPAQLLEVTAPVALTGVVADTIAPGQLRVATPAGDVQLRIPGDIPVGRAVTIVIRPGARLEAFVLPSATPAAPLNAASPRPSAVLPPGPPLVPNPPTPATPDGAPGAPKLPPVSTPASGGPAANGAAAAASPGNGSDAIKAAVVPAQQAPHPSTPPTATLSPASILATLGLAEVSDAIATTPYALPRQPTPTSELVALVTDMRRLVAMRDPKLAERFLRRLPGTDRAGGLALAALPIAAERGSLASWFGHAIREILDDGDTGDLLDRLAAGLTAAERRAEATGERTWRWRQVPFVDHGHIVPLFIGITADHEQADGGGMAPRQRPRAVEFAVEVTLSHLGRARIDATYRQWRLDLSVQCEMEIGRETREQIVAAVAAVFDEFGLGGSCRFGPFAASPAAAEAVKI